MQDYNYLYGNCMEVTFELSCCKHPRATELHKEWDLNRESLLAYMEKVSCPLKTKETDNSCGSITVSRESWKLQLMVTLSPLQNATHLLFMCLEQLCGRAVL